MESLPDGPENPYGVGFVANETVLHSEKEAQRMGDLNTSRVWKIKNPNSVNPLNGELLSREVPFQMTLRFSVGPCRRTARLD